MSLNAAIVLERVVAVPGARALLGRPGTWLVGGAVRDALLGAPVRDLDIVVEGDALAFARSLGEVAEEHERFGTAEVHVDGGRVNVARARTETYAAPGALPAVAFASIAEDLARRDLTINAIAAPLDGGDLLAVPRALEDLDARRARILHERSFIDDPTRALRLARYAARLGLQVEPETERLAGAADLGTVSGERVGAELMLALAEPDPVAALSAITALGHLPWLQPRATLPFGDPGLRALAGAVMHLEPKAARARLDGLGLPARARDTAVGAAAASHDGRAERLAVASRPSEIAALCRELPDEAAAALGAVRWLEELREVVLAITGDDLRAAGIAEGPALGERLRHTLDAVLDGDVGPHDRDAQLAFALA